MSVKKLHHDYGNDYSNSLWPFISGAAEGGNGNTLSLVKGKYRRGGKMSFSHSKFTVCVFLEEKPKSSFTEWKYMARFLWRVLCIKN